MYKKTITSTDFEGNKITKDYWFNLSKFELTELQASKDRGFAEDLQSSVDRENTRGIISSVKDLILKAYGERTSDGVGFVKKDIDGRPLATMFETTDAFSVLYYDLLASEKAVKDFILNIVPADMAKQVLLQINEVASTEDAPKKASTSKK